MPPFEQFIEADNSWSAKLDQGMELKLNIENYWTITFECLDTVREDSLVKQYWLDD